MSDPIKTLTQGGQKHHLDKQPLAESGVCSVFSQPHL